MRLRIGLTQRVEHLPDREERRDCLDQAWTPLLLALGFWPIPLPNCTDDPRALVDELQLHGIILTGGNDVNEAPGATRTAPERDRFERTLLSVCAETGLPVLGVCRGLQLLVIHYGGKLVPIPGHAATSHPIRSRPGTSALTDREAVNSFHAFGIREETLSPEIEALATAPDGSVEAVRHRRFRQWGIMWHPERPPHDAQNATLLRALFTRVARL